MGTSKYIFTPYIVVLFYLDCGHKLKDTYNLLRRAIFTGIPRKLQTQLDRSVDEGAGLCVDRWRFTIQLPSAPPPPFSRLSLSLSFTPPKGTGKAEITVMSRTIKGSPLQYIKFSFAYWACCQEGCLSKFSVRFVIR